MSEIICKIEWLNMNCNELENYILTLNGVDKVKINTDTDEIYIKYDSTIISIKLLVLEIKLFLDILDTPSIIKFNKFSKKKLINSQLNLGDLCCEYCVKGTIESLMLLNGIEMASVDLDNINYYDVIIKIKYDENKITNKELKQLEQELKL